MLNLYEIVVIIVAVTITYALYVQFSPSMGGIWLRKDHDNNTVFCPFNLMNLMFSPLYKRELWSLWDINWFVWLGGGIFMGIVVKSFCDT